MRALLVGVVFGSGRTADESLDELAALVTSDGMLPVGREVCRRSRQDPEFFIGSGKADALAERIKAEEIAVVVFDQELSAVQQRNLGEHWGVPVLDRTELILDIFARRARSHEGKLQVELARLEHLSARLVRGWTHLERQRGGIGVRGGPGEKQIELDRRMLTTRVRRLRVQLEQIRKQRRNRRRARQRREVFSVSLVGYTNSGKSTLFNALAKSDTYAADQLFATLDTLSRRVRLPGGGWIVLSDTVGFVRDLPHQLVDAFQATLEETAEADLLIHVVDASAPDRDEQVLQVERVLAEIGASEVPCLRVLNKIDLTGWPPEVERDSCGSIVKLMVSALTGAGIDDLREAIEQRVRARGGGVEPKISGPDAEIDGEPGLSGPIPETRQTVA
ncbi:MAG: GTPase HflX [Burkholderiaceae bacterium]|nr:GTPase HflX [Burkholderiaceae bacterium]